MWAIVVQTYFKKSAFSVSKSNNHLEILLERLLDFLSLSDLVSDMSWNWKRENKTTWEEELEYQAGGGKIQNKTRTFGLQQIIIWWTWTSGGGSSPVFNLSTTIDSSLTQSICSTALWALFSHFRPHFTELKTICSIFIRRKLPKLTSHLFANLVLHHWT